jgi:hypothetical protein
MALQKGHFLDTTQIKTFGRRTKGSRPRQTPGVAPSKSPECTTTRKCNRRLKRPCSEKVVPSYPGSLPKNTSILPILTQNGSRIGLTQLSICIQLNRRVSQSIVLAARATGSRDC